MLANCHFLPGIKRTLYHNQVHSLWESRINLISKNQSMLREKSHMNASIDAVKVTWQNSTSIYGILKNFSKQRNRNCAQSDKEVCKKSIANIILKCKKSPKSEMTRLSTLNDIMNIILEVLNKTIRHEKK